MGEPHGIDLHNCGFAQMAFDCGSPICIYQMRDWRVLVRWCGGSDCRKNEKYPC